jgi:hypothetical protein
MRSAVAICLIIAGVIHLIPATGVFGAATIASLYEIDTTDPTVAILMRHRAAVFGLIGAFLVVAAFVPTYQPPAIVMGIASAAIFVVIAWTTVGGSPAIATIVRGDLVALAALALAALVRTRA